MINDIFTILSGKRLTKADMKNGKMPFIGATEADNGITHFVSNINVSADDNVFGVNYNGSVVETFYHPYQCIFSDDVKRFKLKEPRYRNAYTYLFLKTTILQQKTKYAYGYKFNEERMNKQYIMLPTIKTGQADWDYMEQYGRAMVVRLLGEYFEYIMEER
jgi:restriction endonuclease S subunit